jgi:glyoxylase-like metal-dependent hydrolase (beta-lactamase superfamily II)
MHWTVGDARITKVVEHEFTMSMDQFLVGATPEVVARHPWLKPHFLTNDGEPRISLHALVVDTGTRRVLVDTCVGDEHRERMGGLLGTTPSGFLTALADAGYARGDIDTVVCTHLHFDHVGWNTQIVDGERRVTFPYARYLFARTEWEYWRDSDSPQLNLGDTVSPVFDADQVDLVEVDHVVCDEIRLEPSPGHTPGHVCVMIASKGARAVITGDLAHHPLQLAEPEIHSPVDSDSAMSTATRQRFRAERLADGALVIGTHFAGATAGRIASEGDVWKFEV